MKKFLTTTAVTLAFATSAMADSHTSAFSDMTFDQAVNLNASELIGMRVYASEADIENNSTIAQDGETEWDDIGEINEIVLTRDGEVQSVIVGVGGFIGIGEKDVAVSMDQIRFVNEDGGDADDFFLVVNASAAGVEEAPEYDRMMTRDADMAEPETDTDMADANADMERMPLTRPMVEREGYADFDYEAEDLNTEDLTGARVYGANDEDIGEISELLVNDDGEIERAVLDIGGFLGMGEHSIAVPMEELQILRSDGGDDFRVYIDNTQESLEAQPEYEG